MASISEDQINYTEIKPWTFTGVSIEGRTTPNDIFALTITDSEFLKVIVRIRSDGTIELGENIHSDTAAKYFWKTVGELFGYYHEMYEVASEIQNRASDLSCGLNLREHRPWLDKLAEITKKVEWIYPPATILIPY